MLFGALILCFVLARVKSPVWPPLGISPIPRFLPTFSTLALGVSSVLVGKGFAAWKKGAPKFNDFKFFWGLGIFAGLAFGVLQAVALVQWMQTFDVRGSVYSSSIAFLIIFHGLHFLLGLAGLVWKFLRPQSTQSLRLWSWFWHFLGIVWLAVFLVVIL